MPDWINVFDVESTLGNKILIAGLKEAGKTAVKKIFFLKQKIVDVENLKATINYERMAVKISGNTITVIDLGGQRLFIKRFLNLLSPFIFNGVKIFVFVIDVSDKTVINNAIQYFKGCIEKIEEYSSDADVFVFLHKNDLIKDRPNHLSIISQLKEEFQVETTRRLRFFTTSIFEPSTIINTFGRIFELSIPSAAKSKLVEGRIIGKGEEYAEKYAVLEKISSICPNCNIAMVETKEDLRCSICDHSIKIQVKTKKGISDKKKNIIEKLESQLQKIIIKENPLETPENMEPVFFIDQSENHQLDYEQEKLPNYYNFSEEETELILKTGLYDILNLSKKFRVKKEVISTIFFQYLPKIDFLNLSLSKNLLFGIISAYVNGVINEEEIFDLMQKSIYFPSLSIEELIWNNFPIKKTSNVDVIETKDVEIVDDSIEILSEADDIGFKLLKRDYNFELSIYKKKTNIQTVSLPINIKEVDLSYLFAFELKIPEIPNFKEFVKTSVTKISSEIRKLNVKKSDDLVSDTKKSTEIKKLNEKFEIFYKININDSGFKINFLKGAQNFGEITGSNDIRAPDLFQKIRDKTLISTIIPEDDLMFSVLELFNNYSDLLK